MLNQFTAVFVQEEGGWVAYAAELPGANTQGATLDEARANLREAVAMVLDANREIAEQRLAGQAVVRETLEVTRA